MRGTFVLLIVAVLVLTSCRCDQGTVSSACAVYAACVDDNYGIGSCVRFLNASMRLPRSELGMLPLGMLSLIQNIDCVARAGKDCDSALECLNRGEADRDCHPGSYCDEENIITTCVDVSTGSDNGYVKMRVDCGDLGLDCVLVMGMGSHMCATQESQTISGMQVTCEGNIAKVRIADVSVSMDCGLRGARCVPGTYEDGKAHHCEESGPGSYRP